MSKYYVKFRLEVYVVDEKTEAIKPQSLIYTAPDTVTARPDLYIKKALKDQAAELTKVIASKGDSK